MEKLLCTETLNLEDTSTNCAFAIEKTERKAYMCLGSPDNSDYRSAARPEEFPLETDFVLSAPRGIRATLTRSWTCPELMATNRDSTGSASRR